MCALGRALVVKVSCVECHSAMGVGLQPLEFSECLADSPAFRENLLRHEKELERTSHQIKRLIKEVKDVVSAAKREYQLTLLLHPDLTLLA